MRFLLDTNVLIWTLDRETFGAGRLSDVAIRIVEDPEVELLFSVVNVWEIAIKFALHRPAFRIDPAIVRAGAIAAGLPELSVSGDHALAVGRLPPIHRDPFDRILVAQAQVENLTLLTADRTIAQYPGPIRFV